MIPIRISFGIPTTISSLIFHGTGCTGSCVPCLRSLQHTATHCNNTMQHTLLTHYNTIK